MIEMNLNVNLYDLSGFSLLSSQGHHDAALLDHPPVKMELDCSQTWPLGRVCPGLKARLRPLGIGLA